MWRWRRRPSVLLGEVAGGDQVFLKSQEGPGRTVSSKTSGNGILADLKLRSGPALLDITTSPPPFHRLGN